MPQWSMQAAAAEAQPERLLRPPDLLQCNTASPAAITGLQCCGKNCMERLMMTMFSGNGLAVGQHVAPMAPGRQPHHDWHQSGPRPCAQPRYLPCNYLGESSVLWRLGVKVSVHLDCLQHEAAAREAVKASCTACRLSGQESLCKIISGCATLNKVA